MTMNAPITLEQKRAEDLALNYRGYMRGLDNRCSFDIWYYGEKLLKAQEAIGFDMVEPRALTALVDISRQKLAETVAPHRPRVLDVA
jgi:hypothetical protein